MTVLHDNLPQYILLTIVLIFFLIFLYIKLIFPFWNIQPVYHIYDFWRCLYTRPFRIYGRFHPKIRTKYCNPSKVDTIAFVNATVENKKSFVNLLQCYWMASEDTLFMFHLDNLEAYFGGHIFASYISFYKDIFYKSNDGEIIKDEEARGCISSRSGTLTVKGNKENIYYIDFMTTVRGLKNKTAIYRELFDTHIYNVGWNEWRDEVDTKENCRTEPIRVGLFCRMGDTIGIMPFVRFMRRVYEIPNNPGFFKGIQYPEHVVLVEICDSNIRKMMDGLEKGLSKFNVCGMTDMSNLVGLIKSGAIYVYVLERLGEVLAIYIFRDTRIRVEMDGSIIELVGSIYINGSVGLFQNGFLGSIKDIMKKHSVYRRIQIDDISDNAGLNLSEWYCMEEEKGAYYLFNLVVPFSCNSSGAFVCF